MKRIFKVFITLCCAIIGVILVTQGNVIAVGVAKGLHLCFETVIPSLFCFMVLTEFLVQSGLYRILSVPLSPVTKHLFSLPPSLGSIVLLSLIGGYPMGAKAISELLKQHQIDLDTAQRMLSFCFCAGPSFVITAVGRGMFGSSFIGMLLYLIQVGISIVFAVISGISYRHTTKRKNTPLLLPPVVLPAIPPSPQFFSFSRSFVTSVAQAVYTCSQMCGFVVLFKAVSELITSAIKNASLSCAALGILEVTNGCALSASLPMGAVYASLFLSFGGLSVLAQVAGILNGSSLSVKKLFLSRCVHAMCSSGVMFCILKLFPQVTAAFSSTAQPIPVSEHNTPILTVCFMMMSILLIRELPPFHRRNIS